MSHVIAYRHYPTIRDMDRMHAAARRRSKRDAARRDVRRQRLIDAAIDRLRHGGEAFGWAARERARVARTAYAMTIDAYTRGHRDGWRASSEVTEAWVPSEEPRRAEWERREVA